MALEQARAGAPHGTAFAALRQSAGRGRGTRSWTSPEGGLYISIIVRPKIEKKNWGLLALATGMGAAKAVEIISQEAGDCLEIGLKWPNDLLHEGRKLGGILCHGSPGEYGVLGIGLNVNTPVEKLSTDIRASATSLLDISGKQLRLRWVAEMVRKEVLAAIAQIETANGPFLQSYNERCINSKARVHWEGGQGTSCGITDTGSLRVHLSSGETIELTEEVHLDTPSSDANPPEQLDEMISALIRIPGDPGKEKARLKLCARWLEDHELEWQKVEGFGGNLMAISRGIGPRIVLAAHVDTVPAQPGWKDPLSPTHTQHDDGQPLLTGLGSADMLAGVVVAIEAFRSAARAKCNCTLVLCCDEEGYSRGVNKALEEGLTGDIALVPEPSHERLMLGARGRLVLELEVTGRSSHAARPELGLSAAAVAGKLVEALEAVDCPPVAPLDRGAFVVLELESRALGLSLPTTARLLVDRHVVLGETSEGIIKEVELIASRTLPRDYRAEVRVAQRPTPAPKPYTVPPSEPLVAAFAACLPPDQREPIYGRSVGDYNFLAERMPAVVFGPRGGNWHAEGEWVDMDSVTRVLEVYRHFITGARGR